MMNCSSCLLSESSDTPGWWRGWPSTPWPTRPLFTFYRRCWALPPLSPPILRLLVLSSPCFRKKAVLLFVSVEMYWHKWPKKFINFLPRHSILFWTIESWIKALCYIFMYCYMWWKLLYSLQLVKFPIRSALKKRFSCIPGNVIFIANVECGSLNTTSRKLMVNFSTPISHAAFFGTRTDDETT